MSTDLQSVDLASGVSRPVVPPSLPPPDMILPTPRGHPRFPAGLPTRRKVSVAEAPRSGVAAGLSLVGVKCSKGARQDGCTRGGGGKAEDGTPPPPPVSHSPHHSTAASGSMVGRRGTLRGRRRRSRRHQAGSEALCHGDGVRWLVWEETSGGGNRGGGKRGCWKVWVGLHDRCSVSGGGGCTRRRDERAGS